MKKIIIIALIIVLSIFLFNSLPVSIRYYSDISIGNKYINNIINYQDSIGKLPNSYDWKLLKQLIPKQTETEWGHLNPQYHKLDSLHFELIYNIGFDGPYLRYCSYDKEWSEGFSCN